MAVMAKEGPQHAGASFSHNYLRRTVTVYGVMEHEMDNLTTWNTLGSIFYSVSAFCVSFALTLYLEDQVSPERTPAGELLISGGVPFAILGGIVSFGLGVWFTWKRGGTLKRIKKESESIDDPT